MFENHTEGNVYRLKSPYGTGTLDMVEFQYFLVNRDANLKLSLNLTAGNLTARVERSTVRSRFRMSCLPVKNDWAFHLSVVSLE